MAQKMYKCFKWTCQKSRRTCHKKFVNVGSGSDIFDGCTFPIGELTPLGGIQFLLPKRANHKNGTQEFPEKFH